MKKYFKFISLVIMLGILIMSCNKETPDPNPINEETVISNDLLKGIYNPKKKIRAVYEQYQGEKILTEEWTWNDNLLTKIIYPNEEEKYTVFEYNNKQLVKVTEYYQGNLQGYMIFSYNNSLLQKIEIYSDLSLLELKIDVTHDNKKVTKMYMTEYFNDQEEMSLKSIHRNEMLSRMMQFIVGKEGAYRIVKLMQRKSAQNYSIEFTYDGENVASEKIIVEGEIYLTYNYTYDNNVNPFYGAFYFGESGSLALSKNNVIKETQTLIYEEETFTYDYSYVYNDVFPVEVMVSFLYYDEMYTYTTYYEYLD